MVAELSFELYNVFLIKWQILLIKSLLAKFSQPFIQVLQARWQWNFKSRFRDLAFLKICIRKKFPPMPMPEKILPVESVWDECERESEREHYIVSDGLCFPHSLDLPAQLWWKRYDGISKRSWIVRYALTLGDMAQTASIKFIVVSETKWIFLPYLIFVIFSPHTQSLVKFFSTQKCVNRNKTDFATKRRKSQQNQFLDKTA